MIRARLKRLHSPDVGDLPAFEPEDPENVGFLLQLMIGPYDGDGEESFDVIVCTPRWLSDHYRDAPLRALRHHVLVHTYDYAALEKELRRLVEQCIGETWKDVAAQLAKLGHREFEDYSPSERSR